MKRLFDVVISVIIIILFIPVILTIAWIIRISMGNPILFCQKRPGLDGKIFKMYKFRTMTNNKDMDGNLLDSQKRITKLGLFLRNTSLDELPELLNVIRGEMSLVGPRPLRVEYLSLYSSEQKKRHNVKPGITGWAQINGRNNIEWDEKIKLDVWYVNNQSLKLDFKILMSTLYKVIRQENINDSTGKMVKPFKGVSLYD